MRKKEREGVCCVEACPESELKKRNLYARMPVLYGTTCRGFAAPSLKDKVVRAILLPMHAHTTSSYASKI